MNLNTSYKKRPKSPFTFPNSASFLPNPLVFLEQLVFCNERGVYLHQLIWKTSQMPLPAKFSDWCLLVLLIPQAQSSRIFEKKGCIILSSDKSIKLVATHIHQIKNYQDFIMYVLYSLLIIEIDPLYSPSTLY